MPISSSTQRLRLSHILSLMVLAVACAHSGPGQRGVGPSMSTSGWTNPVTTEASHDLRVLVRTPKDSAEKEWFRMHQAERLGVEAGRPILAVIQGSDAFGWADTVVMDRRSLVPLHEQLVLKDRVIRVTYRNTSVTRVEQVGDSAPRTTVRQYPVQVYAFNQLDLLMRALPYQVGATTILPLYSEMTDELEHDTLEVLSGPSSSAPWWSLRFADPAIISTVTIDPTTRAFLSYETRWRTRPGVMRRVP